MENTIQITIFVLINTKLLSLEAEKNFLKVSSFSNLENAYLDLRQLDSSTTYLEEDPLIREDICKTILNSSSFLEIHQNLASSRVMHENSFTPENILKSIPSKITKLYQQREIFTREGKLYESLLLCSAWDSTSRTIEEYFISRQYRDRKTNIRFVFAFNEKRKLVIIAKTEANT